jgi:hypothetical protein
VGFCVRGRGGKIRSDYRPQRRSLLRAASSLKTIIFPCPKSPLGLARAQKASLPLALSRTGQTLSPAATDCWRQRARGAKLISACAVITLLHHNHYVALETRWNLLAPQYVCVRAAPRALQKSSTTTTTPHRMQTLSRPDNKKGARIFYVIITSTFKVERMIVKFYERRRTGAV